MRHITCVSRWTVPAVFLLLCLTTRTVSGKEAYEISQEEYEAWEASHQPDNANNVGPHTAWHKIPASELEAWKALYDAAGGAKWFHCHDQRNDPCSCGAQWINVQCNNGHIESIYMSRNNMRGTIPKEIEAMPLKALHLNDNKLTGDVPGVNWKGIENCDISGNPFACPVSAFDKENCQAHCKKDKRKWHTIKSKDEL
jgi:hypothetical protein